MYSFTRRTFTIATLPATSSAAETTACCSKRKKNKKRAKSPGAIHSDTSTGACSWAYACSSASTADQQVLQQYYRDYYEQVEENEQDDDGDDPLDEDDVIPVLVVSPAYTKPKREAQRAPVSGKINK